MIVQHLYHTFIGNAPSLPPIFFKGEEEIPIFDIWSTFFWIPLCHVLCF